MLILSRRVGEAIIIDGKIRIMVTNVHGNQVKIGVEANGLIVDREEIHEQRNGAVRGFWPCGHEKVNPKDRSCRWCPPA